MVVLYWAAMIVFFIGLMFICELLFKKYDRVAVIKAYYIGVICLAIGRIWEIIFQLINSK